MQLHEGTSIIYEKFKLFEMFHMRRFKRQHSIFIY